MDESTVGRWASGLPGSEKGQAACSDACRIYFKWLMKSSEPIDMFFDTSYVLSYAPCTLINWHITRICINVGIL